MGSDSDGLGRIPNAAVLTTQAIYNNAPMAKKPANQVRQLLNLVLKPGPRPGVAPPRMWILAKSRVTDPLRSVRLSCITIPSHSAQ
jgi:hypothetical protein